MSKMKLQTEAYGIVLEDAGDYCCPGMKHLMDKGYLHPMINLFGGGEPIAPAIPGPRLTPTGKKREAYFIISFCPICGTPQPYQKKEKASES